MCYDDANMSQPDKLQNRNPIASSSSHIDRMLDDGESVVWQGKPAAKTYVLGSLNPLAILIGLFFVTTGVVAAGGADLAFSSLWVWIGLAMAFSPLIYALLTYSRTFYAITSKRVFIQSGIIGTDFKAIDFDKITSVDVRVGLKDKLFGGGNSGTIYIEDGTVTQKGRPLGKKLDSVSNPYEVFKKLKGVSHAVKADIAYPNAMRPDKNSGYNTKLRT